jgi:serine/threonine protein kinase
VENPKDFAVKVLLKNEMSERALNMIREEISVLSMLDHTNIIKYVESFEDHRYMYIVTEYV